AAGLSFVQMKQPNPLPVGPGAFATFEVPEVAGGLTGSSATARTSLVYPGPVVAGLPALLCTAGATPFCGQPPPPVVAEAESPQKPDATLATDALSFRQPSVPLTTGAGSGEAHVTATSSTSSAELGAYRVAPPDPARKAILDALAATIGRLPGARRVDDASLLSFGGGRVTQTIRPVGGGRIRTESRSRIDDVVLLAGAVTIDSVTVTAFAVADGDQVHDAGSQTSAAGVLVGGFPATIGPNGFVINGTGDSGNGRQQLNGVARQLGDAVTMATRKLRLQVRDGNATREADGGGAAADGLRISLASAQLTDASPPQVPALCKVTGPVQDPLSAGGLSLPPICAVPDLTGTSDSYDFLLGRASVALAGQRFPAFDDSVLGPVGTGGSALDVGAGGPPGIAGSAGPTATGGRRSILRPPVPGFLQLEAKWLGAADRFPDVYLAVAALATLLLLTSHVVLRSTRTALRKEAP
ncbi:MAG: hypothetical protein JWO68_1402, partial [Actinomycetia bacterium]|nr:hypothetical protein [Actinomycetes bacterium]